MNMKIIYLVAIFIGLSLFFIVRKEVTFHAKFKHGNHTEIFHFLSSVDNFQVLNPTIIQITAWEQINEADFVVLYTEHLSQVPVVKNYATACYQILKHDNGSYELVSNHLTCFFTGFLCLSTDSNLQISQPSQLEVSYQERISYMCPWILSEFCFQEIAFQRQMIISKLNEVFSGVDTLKQEPKGFSFGKSQVKNRLT